MVKGNRVFLTADLHLGHKKLAEVRGFKSTDEHDQHIKERWNSVVTDKDKVYVLGDVCFGKKNMYKLNELNGRKILIKGNHDDLKASIYLQYFHDIRASHQLDMYLLTHIPVHPISAHRWVGNIHGHTHAHKVRGSKYMCVSLEQTDFYPVLFDEVKKWKLAEKRTVQSVEHSLETKKGMESTLSVWKTMKSMMVSAIGSVLNVIRYGIDGLMRK